MKDWIQTLAVSIVSVLVWSCTDTTDPAIRFVRSTESVVEVRTESRVPDHDLQIRLWIALMMTKYGLDDDAGEVTAKYFPSWYSAECGKLAWRAVKRP